MPTDNYDVKILDQNDIDVLQGVGLNRDFVASEDAAIVYSGTSVQPYVDESDTLTLQITNNLVNSAVVTVLLYYLGDRP